jgi:hypothetical protein
MSASAQAIAFVTQRLRVCSFPFSLSVGLSINLCINVLDGLLVRWLQAAGAHSEGRDSDCNGRVRKTHAPFFLNMFPLFVPSLSWQNDRFYSLYKLLKKGGRGFAQGDGDSDALRRLLPYHATGE